MKLFRKVDSLRLLGRGNVSSVSEQLFLNSVAIVILVTGLAKMFSAGGCDRILEQPDPILLLNLGHVLLGTALLEIAVAMYLLIGGNSLRKLLLVLWLGMSFLLYHVLLGVTHPGKPCPCLGSAAKWLNVGPGAITWFLRLVIAYMMIGSTLCLLARRLPPRPPPANSETA